MLWDVLYLYPLSKRIFFFFPKHFYSRSLSSVPSRTSYILQYTYILAHQKSSVLERKHRRFYLFMKKKKKTITIPKINESNREDRCGKMIGRKQQTVTRRNTRLTLHCMSPLLDMRSFLPRQRNDGPTPHRYSSTQGLPTKIYCIKYCMLKS